MGGPGVGGRTFQNESTVNCFSCDVLNLKRFRFPFGDVPHLKVSVLAREEDVARVGEGPGG